MKYLNRQAKALIICAISLCILCIVSVSYSYFSTIIESDVKPLELIMGTMKLRFDDSTNSVVLDNAFPGDYVTKKFNVTNIGNLDTTYNIKVFDVTNTFIDKEDLVYTLKRIKDETSEDVIADQVVPDRNGYIYINQPITKEEEHEYELTITFRETEEDQNDNQKKKLELRVEIDTKEGVQLYQYKPSYKDQSGANPPELYEGMIPIYYDENNKIKIADITDKWYDYNEHKWGNAVLIDNTNSNIRNKFYDEEGNLRINTEVEESDILQMYVWIPRYKYQLWNVNNQAKPKQMINVEFESEVDNTGDITCSYSNLKNGTIAESCVRKGTTIAAQNNDWYTHPAFKFGTTELKGIWVGKFESSDPADITGRTNTTLNEITILPNKASVVVKNMRTVFTASRNIEQVYASKYYLNANEIDSHMMKNSEWGAVVYLSQSKYGIYQNSSTCNISGVAVSDCQVWMNVNLQGNSNTGDMAFGGAVTGCVGTSAVGEVEWNTGAVGSAGTCPEGRKWNQKGNGSTTGTIYGIYDMAGGAWDRVMGTRVTSTGEMNIDSVNGFEVFPASKYYDIYSYSDSNLNFSYGHLGDATREVVATIGDTNYSWNSNSANYFTLKYEWFTRGGYAYDGAISGVFAFESIDGQPYKTNSFRVVLTAQDGVD